MIIEMLRDAHLRRREEPSFGNHVRETISAIKDIIHVRKCDEIDCPRCLEPGVNGSRPLHSGR